MRCVSDEILVSSNYKNIFFTFEGFGGDKEIQFFNFQENNKFINSGSFIALELNYTLNKPPKEVNFFSISKGLF
jgi:hypothetical protein